MHAEYPYHGPSLPPQRSTGEVARRCHAGAVLETLTGIELATSAGLNAYIPLLAIGLMGRFTDLMELPPGWQWLQNDWVLGSWSCC